MFLICGSEDGCAPEARSAEIIASQGTPLRLRSGTAPEPPPHCNGDVPAVPSHWDRPQRLSRLGKTEKYSFTVDVREALDRSFPLAAGVQDDEPQPCGFHVPVQRGLGCQPWSVGMARGDDGAGAAQDRGRRPSKLPAQPQVYSREPGRPSFALARPPPALPGKTPLTPQQHSRRDEASSRAPSFVVVRPLASAGPPAPQQKVQPLDGYRSPMPLWSPPSFLVVSRREPLCVPMRASQEVLAPALKPFINSVDPLFAWLRTIPTALKAA